MTRCVALLRGINVGRAKRVPMAGLRGLLEKLGYTDVRTVLNSGNAVFQAPRPGVGRMAREIEAALESRFGFPVPVIVLTARELDDIVAGNTLRRAGRDPSRLLVAFVAGRAALAEARTLLVKSWTPDALAVGDRAAYLWCAGGIIESKLMQAFTRATGEAATTRNWATVLKLQAAAGTGEDAG